MSDPKKPGSRDISDLKARLGLKKGAAAPAASSPTTRPNGVVAPPGLNLPPPPGVATAPPQPVIPNAAEDPFAAMNAMAAVGTVQRAPEIVIRHDGAPVEHVGKRSRGAQIAMIAVPALGGLLAGVAIGKIGEANSTYNASLSDAKAILGTKEAPSTIASLQNTLSQIDTVLDEARTKNRLKPDAAVDKKLETLVKALDVQTNVVFRAKQNAMDPEVAVQVLKFYSGVAEVKSMLEAHLLLAKGDNNAFAKAKQKGETNTLKEGTNALFAGQVKYAVVVSAPDDKNKDAEFGAKLVELDGVYCGSSTAPQARCPEGEQPAALAYRADSTSKIFLRAELATPAPDNVPTKKILPLISGGTGSVLNQFLEGAEGNAAELFYQRRLEAVSNRICKREQGKCTIDSLLEFGSAVKSRVEQESNKSSKFSFFM